MARPRRLQLQTKLEEILGSNHVYFNPPSNVKMVYPAIRYNLHDIRVNSADNRGYISNDYWDLTLIDTTPDSQLVEAILSLQYCTLQRPMYTADGLYHWVFSIYF